MTEIVLQVIFWVLLFGFISESIWARYNLKCQNKGRVTVKNIFFVIGMLFLWADAMTQWWQIGI